MKKPKKRPLFRSEINVTPFIDILLVLLVIFMTITPITPSGLKTVIPQPPPPDAEQHDQDKVIVLTVDQNGILRINQEEVDQSRLIDRLREIFRTRNERSIFVQADHELLFNDVAQAIDSAMTAGVERVGLMTDHITPAR